MMKPKDMFVLSIIPMFVILVLFMLSRHQQNDFLYFIERFQALIAGSFAIVAAVVTVAQMRISEQKQSIRHKETIKVANRHDRNLIARETRLIAIRGKRIAESHEVIACDYFIARRTPIAAVEYLLDNYRRMIELINSLEKGEVKQHFTPDAFMALEFLLTVKTEFEGVRDDLHSLIIPEYHPMDPSPMEPVKSLMGEAKSVVCTTYDQFKSIQTCIVELMVEYDVDTSFMNK